MFTVSMTPTGKTMLLSKNLNMFSDTLKMVLSPGGSISASQLFMVPVISASGNYPRMGVTLTNMKLAADAVSPEVALSADSISLTGITGTFSRAFIYTPGLFTIPGSSGDTQVADPIIAMIDFGQTYSLTSTDFAVNWQSGRTITLA